MIDSPSARGRSEAASPATYDHDALVALLHELKALRYEFVTPTPATHRRVVGRPGKAHAADLRDILGWSLPFAEASAPGAVIDLMRSAGVLRETNAGLRSAVRVSSLGGDLFLHAAFPPKADDAVFFGPDTYRFAQFLRHTLAGGGQVDQAVDVGCGSGAGAVTLARTTSCRRLVLTDINPSALELARANLAAAMIQAEYRLASGVACDGRADLIIANPPFIADPAERTYRHGGDMHGARLSLDWCLSGVAQLAVKGRLLLYSGSAIVQGIDQLYQALAQRLPGDIDLDYRELDPDIFGGQLSQPGYADVERIAAVGAVMTRRA